MKRYNGATEALSLLTSHSRIFIHTAAATPLTLVSALTDHASRLKNVEIVSIHTEGEALYADEKYTGIFEPNVFFIGKNIRPYIKKHRAQFVPMFLSEIPLLFEKNILPIDVALISVSPPDRNGYCTLGPSVDVSLAAVKNAKIVIAEINKHMPRVFGDGIIHTSQITGYIEVDRPLPETIPEKVTDIELKIGKHCADLITDGSTLQMGIGSIPDAVLASLTSHRDLGVHTEMFSDGLIPLLEKGIVNNRLKKKYNGKVVSSFVTGTKKVFDFIHDNPMVNLLNTAYVNDTAVIKQIPKMVAINSAIEVDLTGQVCADSIGNQVFSGIGGQMDFIRGASLSSGGVPIIALSSTTNKGESKITTNLKMGAGVVTTRANVHFVVTEYGVANLYGKNLKQRAQALINIAHPDHQERLTKEAFYLH